MRTRSILAGVLAVLAAAALTSCGKKTTAPLPPADTSLRGVLARSREVNHLPAIAGVVIRGDSIAEIEALGLRRLGGADSVTIDDHYDLGSNVKAMTADLVAMEVEAGRLAWDETLAQAFPEFADTMRAEYRDVTLAAVLQHRGGFPAYTEAESLARVPAFAGTLAERRLATVRWLLRQPPAVPAGQYLYSNAGYVVAGVVLESTTGSPWESLVQTRLWSPLGLSGGFGWPAAGGAPQPWGHYDVGNGTLAPLDPDDPAEQFPDLLRPAGNGHLSIGDYARFVKLHLRGDPQLLSAASFQRLHTPNGSYAMGWGVGPLAGAVSSYHVGSSGTFGVVAVIQPERDLAVVVATNAGSEAALNAIQAAAVQLLAR